MRYGFRGDARCRTNHNGYPDPFRITLSQRGDSFTYTDNIRWYQIYTSNYIAPDSMNYLALGDSYSSGEGDIDQTGSSHYLSFTNVFGDYRNGIPRELCHVSDRSYPFLLAPDMGISQGDNMQSIACSGAVRSDILSVKLNGGADSSYAGQDAPMFSGIFSNSTQSAPQLAGITNAQELQDEAINQFIPGRVQ